MPRGGVRAGSGRKTTAVGARERCRTACDDPARWARFLAAVDQQLAEGNTSGFEAMFRHGYGAPPQALDVNSTIDRGDVVFICQYADGTTAASSAPSVPDDPPE